ncbi:MAG: hypothetical protein NNA23_12965 [Nitrospira sp.]|nr:hypothetical protein [Nitrospira sp.]
MNKAVAHLILFLWCAGVGVVESVCVAVCGKNQVLRKMSSWGLRIVAPGFLAAWLSLQYYHATTTPIVWTGYLGSIWVFDYLVPLWLGIGLGRALRRTR